MKREIIVNGRFLSRRVTGVERYGREIVSHIGNRCRVETTRANGVRGHLWEQFVLPPKMTPQSILWSPANTGPLLVRNQALTIHDLSPLEHPEWFRQSFAAWYRLFLPILARRVRVVFTPSEFVRQKVMERFAVDRVTVTPNGVDTSYFHPDAKQSVYELPGRYILFVGSLQPRKNLQTLLKLWGALKNRYTDLWLVIAGDAGNVFHRVVFAAEERALFLGYVAEEALPGLYAKAALFVLPSFDEGFGLTALEAMACGTPVLVSDGGALPETVAAAGLIAKGSDASSLSTAMQSCLEDTNLRASLIAKGFQRVRMFSWQTTAELIWNTLNEI
jgi:glycosyltransferase involved in cell wall biosynthesis